MPAINGRFNTIYYLLALGVFENPKIVTITQRDNKYIE